MKYRSLVNALSFKTHYGHSELVLQRLLFAFVVYYVFSNVTAYSTQPDPNGFARFIDITFLANPMIYRVLCAVLILALSLYVFRVAMPLALGYMLAFAVCAGTLTNSQGAIGHATQIVALVILGQLLVYSYGWYLRMRNSDFHPNSALTIDDLAVYFTQQMIASVYVVSGLAKLGRSGIGWVLDVKYIAVDITKTHTQHYLDTLDSPEVLAYGTRVAEFIAQHPTLTQVFFGTGLLLELFAFLALINRRMAMIVGLSLLVMHQGILWTMGLNFTNNILVLLIYFVNVPRMLVFVAMRIQKRFELYRGIQSTDSAVIT